MRIEKEMQKAGVGCEEADEWYAYPDHTRTHARARPSPEKPDPKEIEQHNLYPLPNLTKLEAFHLLELCKIESHLYLIHYERLRVNPTYASNHFHVHVANSIDLMDMCQHHIQHLHYWLSCHYNSRTI